MKTEYIRDIYGISLEKIFVKNMQKHFNILANNIILIVL